MKIAMIGTGAAGSVFASYLKLGGADMYLVDLNKKHMDKVKADGMHFLQKGKAQHINGFNTAYTANDIEETMDVVILMVKAMHTENILSSLRHCMDENTMIVSLQNGLGNDELLAKHFPKDHILYGFGTIGTELPEPGVCIAKPESGVIMRFGAMQRSEKSEAVGKALEDCFRRGGCETCFEEDIRPYIWRKAIANSGYNTLSALLRIKVGPMLSNDNGVELIKSVWREGCEVAKAVTGIDLWDEMEDELPRLALGFATYYPSMAQDVLLYQRQTEIMYLNGAISNYGKEYGVPTPVNDTLTRMISCIQENYSVQYSKAAK